MRMAHFTLTRGVSEDVCGILAYASVECRVYRAICDTGGISPLENRQVVIGHLQDEARHGGGVLGVDERV